MNDIEYSYAVKALHHHQRLVTRAAAEQQQQLLRARVRSASRRGVQDGINGVPVDLLASLDPSFGHHHPAAVAAAAAQAAAAAGPPPQTIVRRSGTSMDMGHTRTVSSFDVGALAAKAGVIPSLSSSPTTSTVAIDGVPKFLALPTGTLAVSGGSASRRHNRSLSTPSIAATTSSLTLSSFASIDEEKEGSEKEEESADVFTRLSKPHTRKYRTHGALSDEQNISLLMMAANDDTRAKREKDRQKERASLQAAADATAAATAAAIAAGRTVPLSGVSSPRSPSSSTLTITTDERRPSFGSSIQTRSSGSPRSLTARDSIMSVTSNTADRDRQDAERRGVFGPLLDGLTKLQGTAAVGVIPPSSNASNSDKVDDEERAAREREAEALKQVMSRYDAKEGDDDITRELRPLLRRRAGRGGGARPDLRQLIGVGGSILPQPSAEATAAANALSIPMVAGAPPPLPSLLYGHSVVTSANGKKKVARRNKDLQFETVVVTQSMQGWSVPVANFIHFFRKQPALLRSVVESGGTVRTMRRARFSAGERHWRETLLNIGPNADIVPGSAAAAASLLRGSGGQYEAFVFRSNLLQTPDHVRERVRRRRAEAQLEAEENEAAAAANSIDDDDYNDEDDQISNQNELPDTVSNAFI
jgi:hypothetical protein